MKKVLKVVMIDDNADGFEKQIVNRLDCNFSTYSLEDAYCFFQDYKSIFFDSIDLLILDATYKENEEYCTLDLAELIIAYEPRYKDSLIIMLGKDIEENRFDKYCSGIVKRAKNLPNVVYSNKIDAIVNAIEARGKSLGFL